MRGSGRILVVDNEEGVRTVLQRLLSRIGYEVNAVGDATTALAMLSGMPPRFDLVLSDILMPDMNGLELATELIDARIPVAIVLMTGFADGATVREATETFKLPVLRKPFEVDQLAAVIEDALARTFVLREACSAFRRSPPLAAPLSHGATFRDEEELHTRRREPHSPARQSHRARSRRALSGMARSRG